MQLLKKICLQQWCNMLKKTTIFAAGEDPNWIVEAEYLMWCKKDCVCSIHIKVLSIAYILENHTASTLNKESIVFLPKSLRPLFLLSERKGSSLHQHAPVVSACVGRRYCSERSPRGTVHISSQHSHSLAVCAPSWVWWIQPCLFVLRNWETRREKPLQEHLCVTLSHRAKVSYERIW